jgi:hypothetical protein
MRIASFNVEIMFLRAKALNSDTWDEGRPALERYAKARARRSSSLTDGEIAAST